MLADIERATRRELRAHKRAAQADTKRVAAAGDEVGNLVDAIADGTLRASKAVAERLAAAETALAAMKAATHTVKSQDIDRLVTLVMERYRTMVATLETSLPSCNIEEARAFLGGMFGSIKVESDAREIWFVADLLDTHLALLKGVGGSANNVVAGAGFVRFAGGHFRTSERGRQVRRSA